MSKIKKEKDISKAMISLYCTKNHGTIKELCEDCSSLLEYSWKKLDICKFGDAKTSCKKCPIHCYQDSMREKIRKVMRFSGPRLLFYRPIDFLRYIWNDIF